MNSCKLPLALAKFIRVFYHHHRFLWISDATRRTPSGSASWRCWTWAPRCTTPWPGRTWTTSAQLKSSARPLKVVKYSVKYKIIKLRKRYRKMLRTSDINFPTYNSCIPHQNYVYVFTSKKTNWDEIFIWSRLRIVYTDNTLNLYAQVKHSDKQSI